LREAAAKICIIEDCYFRTAYACVWFLLNVGNSLSNCAKLHIRRLRNWYSWFYILP